MSDQQGLYDKFAVVRKDGKVKHRYCDYFVLDMSHDPHAKKAMVSYVASLERAGDHPLLAQELTDKYLT